MPIATALIKVRRMKTLIFAAALTLSLSARAAESTKVDVKDTTGASIGSARLSDSKKGVEIKLNVKGLTPGKHGMHLHETGKCEGPDFKSAGGHLNPEGKEHGLKNPKGSHEGDMPVITADKDGKSKETVYAPFAKLADLHGKALVIHAQEDDQMTMTSSGGRVACGLIP
jgi:superoxide dismutase, Cu-Zn family